MKWAIVVVLVSGIYETNGGGGLLQTGIEFETLEQCSIEASIYVENWRKAYDQLSETRKQRVNQQKALIQDKFGEEKIREIEALFKARSLKRGEMPAYLRQIGEDELAEHLKDINKLRNWSPNKQARLANDAEAVCIPILN